jgi:EF-P beta-lysylation protein EpmB
MREQECHWRQIQRKNFTSLVKLADFLEWGEKERSLLSPSPFVLNVPLRLAQKMEKKSLEDPLVRQFIPLQEKAPKGLHFLKDPVGDIQARCTPNLLKKYEGRALLITTSACAMHCRYCFRQNYPYETETKGFEKELELIAADPTIEEVILSGGDPLSLSNITLDRLLIDLSKIPHLQRVRFHTRFPIGIPERIDGEFLEALKRSRFQFWLIVHINHPKELDEDLFSRLAEVQKLGIPVLNQAVLLKGVNDSEEALLNLFGTLANRGIFAYYLHQLDKVLGAERFEVAEARGLELIRYLENHLPGYAVPKYVREVPGAGSKVAI